MRYGDVRQTETQAVRKVIDGLLPRLFVGLPRACASVDEELAAKLFKQILAVNGSIRLIDGDIEADWNKALAKIVELPHVAHNIAGLASRILFDSSVWAAEAASKHMSLALGSANPAAEAAAKRSRNGKKTEG